MGADTEIGRLRRGDRDAFDALLSRYQNRLYRYLLRFVREPAQAEDLFQQTWLRVMTRLHRFDERRPFEPWLFTIARNLALDHLRRAKTESLDDGESDRLVSGAPGTYDTVLKGERRRALTERLESLPPLYREALTLRFEEEMTFDEMAALLDCPVSTVKSRVRRGIETLRRRMVRS